MKIGHVDLDTSHPAAWIPIERQLGHEIVGVWDGGSVHPDDYAGRFAAEHKIPRVFSSLNEMASAVDCAIIHSCDWDTHVAKARPFIDAGKSVLIDKPLAGCLRDLRQFQAWTDQGARIAGGSSLRFSFDVQAWLARPQNERGTPHTVFCGGAMDEFNYGIHAYSLIIGIMGAGLQSVRHLGAGVQRRIVARWKDGRMGFLAMGKQDRAFPFFSTIVTEKEVTQLHLDASRLYQALLEASLPFLAGQANTPPIPMDQLIEPELAALAAQHSWLHNDEEVRLDQFQSTDAGYDGTAFAFEYRNMKYPDSLSER